MTNLSNNVKNGQVVGIKPGGAVLSTNDMVQIGGPGLKAYPVKTIDYAITSAITTFLAQTNIYTGLTVTGYARQAACTDNSGNIWTVGAGGVNKYSPLGVSLGSAPNVLISGTPLGSKCLLLSNGNICAIGVDSAAGGITFGIVDGSNNVNQVKGATAVGTTYNAGSISYFDACALTAGGFAVTYLNSAGTQILLQSYDNSGVAVLAATNVQTMAGTPARCYVQMAQLSNGNLTIAINSPTATPAGKSFVVVTTAAVSVKTNTVVETDVTGTFIELSAGVAGYFAIAGANGATNISVSIYNNAGVIQGAKQSLTGSADSAAQIQFKLTSDTVQFWAAYLSVTSLAVTQLPITGTGAVSTVFSGEPGVAGSVDAAIQGNQMLCMTGNPTTGAAHYQHVALPDTEIPIIAPYVAVSGNVGTGAGTTGTRWPRVLFNGDFTGVFVYDQQATANIFMFIRKFAATSILGAMQGSNPVLTQGTPSAPVSVSINTGPGAYLENVLMGTNGTTFDHSMLSPVGNKGVLYHFGATLQGLFTSRRAIN